MKKSLAVIGLLFSQLSFAQNLHNEQACVEHYLISHWDDLQKKPFQVVLEEELFAEKFESSYTILENDKPNSVFYCEKTNLIDNNFLIFEKLEPNNYFSNIKGSWFVKSKGSDLFKNEPSLFNKSFKINEFHVFEFVIDYPL